MGKTAGETIAQIHTDVHTNVHMDRYTNRHDHDSGGEVGSSTRGSWPRKNIEVGYASQLIMTYE